MSPKLTAKQVYDVYKMRFMEGQPTGLTAKTVGISEANIYSVRDSVPKYFHAETARKRGNANAAYYDAAQMLLKDFPYLADTPITGKTKKPKATPVKPPVPAPPVEPQTPVDHYGKMNVAFSDFQKAMQEFIETEFSLKHEAFIKKYSEMEVKNTELSMQNEELRKAVKQNGGLLNALRVTFGHKVNLQEENK